MKVLPWSSPNSPARLWGGHSADTSAGASLAYTPASSPPIKGLTPSGQDTSLEHLPARAHEMVNNVRDEGLRKNGRDASRQLSATTPGISQQGQSTGLAFSGAELSVVLSIIRCLVYFPRPQSRAGPCPERRVSHL